MYRTLIVAASIAALSVPAFAEDITINLAGKTKAQVVEEIHVAAASVCADSGYTKLTEHEACVNELEHQAMVDLAAHEKASKAS
jgi:hypothetical protein